MIGLLSYIKRIELKQKSLEKKVVCGFWWFLLTILLFSSWIAPNFNGSKNSVILTQQNIYIYIFSLSISISLSICRMSIGSCNGAIRVTNESSKRTPPEEDGASLDEHADVAVMKL